MLKGKNHTGFFFFFGLKAGQAPFQPGIFSAAAQRVNEEPIFLSGSC